MVSNTNQHHPPPPNPLPATHCLYILYFDFEVNQREGERGNNSQRWVQNTNMTDCISSLETLLNTSKDDI